MTSYFDSADWEKYRKDEISFIFQNYNLIDSYTCLQNVAIIYILNGYSYKEAKNKAKEKLNLVGLEKEANKKAAKLSGSQMHSTVMLHPDDLVILKRLNIDVTTEVNQDTKLLQR